MKKRTEPTIIEKAILTVEGFEKVQKTIEQQVILLGQSKSTLYNYLRRIAAINLHFGQLESVNNNVHFLANKNVQPFCYHD